MHWISRDFINFSAADCIHQLIHFYQTRRIIDITVNAQRSYFYSPFGTSAQ